MKCSICHLDILLSETSDKIKIVCSHCGYTNIFSTDHSRLEPYQFFARADDADQIRDFAHSRGIKRILHFTTIEGLYGIFKTGYLMSRSEMDSFKESHPESEIIKCFHINDKKRYDSRVYINASIERINKKLFYTFKKRFDNASDVCGAWCILVLRPECLEKQGVLFATSNAASNYTRTNGTRAGIVGIKALFLPKIMTGRYEQYDSIGSNYQVKEVVREECWAMNRTTDPQAEVLIPKSLPIEMISEIIVENDICQKTIEGWMDISKQKIPVKVDRAEFYDKASENASRDNEAL